MSIDEHDTERFRRFAVEPEPQRPLGGRVAFWVALTMVNLVGVCCGWTGWSAPTTESWRYDADVGFAAAFIAFIAFGLAGLGGVLTLIAVAGRWVTRWWYAGPVLVAAMSLLAWIGAGRF